MTRTLCYLLNTVMSPRRSAERQDSRALSGEGRCSPHPQAGLPLRLVCRRPSGSSQRPSLPPSLPPSATGGGMLSVRPRPAARYCDRTMWSQQRRRDLPIVRHERRAPLNHRAVLHSSEAALARAAAYEEKVVADDLMRMPVDRKLCHLNTSHPGKPVLTSKNGQRLCSFSAK